MPAFDHRKYRPAPRVPAFNRQWPDRELTQAPIWVSEDLRDGNQALLEPMTVEQKQRFWHQIIKVGIKEVMVGFPSASQPDYDFVRWLIEEDQIPDDVTIAVLVQCREHLIEKNLCVAGGRQTRHYPSLQLDLYHSAGAGLRDGPRRNYRYCRARGHLGQNLCSAISGRRLALPILT